MAARRWVSAVAAITIPFAVAVQTALAIGGAPPATATPEAPERRESIDPGFVVRFDGDVDPGFIVEFEDRSNDAGFLVIPGGPIPMPTPSPTSVPGTPEAPAAVLRTP